MATPGQSFYELYRRSSIGMALTDTLDDLISERRIEPQLAMKILANFDRSITEVLAEKVKARLTFKGHLDTYRFCDEVWTFLIKDVTFKMENSSQTVQADKVKIQPPLYKGKKHSSVSDSSVSHPTPETITAEEDMEALKTSRHAQWITLAIASGACAAFNGVFAKLTTTKLTTDFATSIAGLFGLDKGEKVVEYIIRAMFFGLNLLFNGVMWALFTKALARGTSTTQVSIINTSSNFMITAILGFIIFSESLPPLWWLGAAMLVAGNVIIGRREEHVDGKDGDAHVAAEGGEGTFREEEEVLLADEVELDERVQAARRKEDEDILELDSD
ncbi:transcription initiation factor IIA, gamma subunit, helical domain-containing protein [Xylogone sp. PMI_703]|nr:transcription initiation factor IIA, gamma subunit, helical domain-containing protein [Xylogone sp. PMI_703]